MSAVKPFAFVLMPFSKEFDDVYQYGIKQACSELGIIAERVDEQFYSETMLERIYRQIDNADIIIADMSGKNPNVFYEVGYAHAKGKLCALITQKLEDIPFDLQHHFHIIYAGRIKELKDQLLPRLEWMTEEIEKAKAEIMTVNVEASYGHLEAGDYFDTGNFDLKILLKNVTKARIEIDNIWLFASDTWTITSGGRECAAEAHDEGTKKFFLPVPNSRLAPGALSQVEITFQKDFWTKWNGAERKDKYKSKGSLIVEVATAAKLLPFNFDLDVEFGDIPF